MGEQAEGANGRTVVFVVEDDDAIQESLKDALEDEGYAVAQARNGREALAYLEHSRPSIILLDYMMPVMNGAMFCEELRKRSPIGVPIVLLTADMRVVVTAPDPGVVAIVRKPMSIDAVLDVIRAHATRPAE